MERKKRKTKLPRTSRVNDRIIEYYKKFGQGRDLEKFMRLYSPGGSQRSCTFSTTTTTSLGSSASDDNICRKRFSKSNRDVPLPQLAASKSLPNMERTNEDEGNEIRHEEIIVPIKLEDKLSGSASAEEISTPKKSLPTKTKHTQTPESVVKSHKRLEWDSLGDVGYFKSMSTSNISMLERTLLKDFFDEQMTPSDSDKVMGKTHIQIKKTVKKLQEKRNSENLGQSKAKLGPLASSTLLESNVLQKQSHSIQNSETKHKKTEKAIQTTLRSVAKANQEVQVSFSSATPSVAGSLTTPTSFSYYSSQSSQSTANSKKPSRQNSQTDTDNSYIKSIANMLAQRRKNAMTASASAPAITEASKRSTQEDVELQQMHETLSEVLDEDKENTSFLHSPQLDLGIKLICSLIDAKTVNQKQRKHLVREIVKRISRIETSSLLPTDSKKQSSSSSSRTNNSDCETARKVVDSLTYRSHKRQSGVGDVENSHRRRQKPLEAPTQSAAAEKQLQTKSMPLISDDVVNSLEKQMRDIRSELLESINSSVSTKAPRTAAKLEVLAEKIKVYEESVPKVPIRTTSRGEARTEVRTKSSHAIATLDRPKAAKSRSAAAKPASLDSANSSSASRDIVTLMSERTINETPTEEELTARREWYNPLTQSEIEYEEKRRTLDPKAKKNLRKQEREKFTSERFIQLNWIDSELERLEGLRKLLLQQDDVISTESIADEPGKQTRVAETGTKTKTKKAVEVVEFDGSEKIYDSVYTAPSSKENMTGVELRIEDSHEATVSNAGQKKHTRERILVTTTTFGRDGQPRTTHSHSYKAISKGDRPEAVAAPPGERSKMETPRSNSDNTASTEESVRSFAEQRKREFLEHYKHKKQEHYADILKRKEEAKEQQHKFRARTASPSTGQTHAENHYSIPHTMPRICPLHCYNPCYHLPYIFPLPPSLPPQPHPQTSHKPSKQDWSSTDRNTSSSAFCLSSEVSIPMGSNPTSSPTTTTHQYDDVSGTCDEVKYVRFTRTGISCQTGPSLLGSHRDSEEGGSKCTCRPRSTKKEPQKNEECRAAAHKKGVAYVITFVKKNPEETAQQNEEKVQEETTETEQTKPDVKKPAKSEGTKTTTSEVKPQPALEDVLRNAYPRFVARAKNREAILREMQTRRQEREREMREIVENTSLSSLEGKLERLPPPPTQQIRVFQTNEMKAMTKRKVSKLMEVVKKKERDNQDRIRRGNRVLKNVFNQRLQKRVRQGQLSLNHSKTLI